MGFSIDEPINRVKWVEADTLHANSWNPNYVLRPELSLLETSILRSGWVHPIIVNRNGLIIDGFHRWMLAMTSEKIKESYGNQVPVVIIDIGTKEAKMMTVRMNRAKGTHQGDLMAKLVTSLIRDDKCEPEEVAHGIGATIDEVNFLNNNSIMKQKSVRDIGYSQAWRPRPNDKMEQARKVREE